MPHKIEPMTKSELLRNAEGELRVFRIELANVTDPNRPDINYRQEFAPERPANEVHSAVDAILSHGDAYDLLTLCLEIERALKQSADAWERTETLMRRCKGDEVDQWIHEVDDA